MTRRSIDSEYMRKKRMSRRPRDNRRRVKKKDCNMTNDRNLYISIAVLLTIWISITAYSIWVAFK